MIPLKEIATEVGLVGELRQSLVAARFFILFDRLKAIDSHSAA